MLRVYACLSTEHDARLVAIAAAICVFATLTAFMLAGQMRRLDRAHRLGWVVALGAATGGGIWATHFIAMLAYQPHMPMAYAPALTILSIVIAMLVSGLAWSQTLRGGAGAWWPSLLFTLGIAAMHFTGMAALQVSGRLIYDLPAVAVVATLGWGLVALAVSRFRRRPERVPVLSALLLSAAICTLHFGAMAAAAIRPDPSIVIPPSAVEKGTLAVMVGSLVVMLLGFAMASALVEMRIARGESEEAERLKQFTDCAMEGLVILDGDMVSEANRIFWLMIGADPAEPPLVRLSTVLPGFVPPTGQGERPRFIEAELRRLDGVATAVDVAIRSANYRGALRQMAVVRDISERKAAAARIAHLATHDPLTGAANRLAFAEALEALAATASPAVPLAMFCIDLDRFKAVNDLYGHPVGDAVLVEVTRRLRACLTDEDVLARLGGDEFVILQPGGLAGAAPALAERVLRALELPYEIGGCRPDLSGSVGVACYPTDAASGGELHRKADVALYRAKAEGRGVARFFDSAMDEQLLRRHRLEVALREAASAGELAIHYQPLASLADGEVVGFEALLRWRNAEFGDVPPSTFIPIAEETGSIVAIGAWVLEAACREAAHWPRTLKIAVNLSPVQFACGDLVATVEQVLAKTGLDPARLDLEITEGVLIKDADRALAVLASLKRLGVSIAMDDFGTGYSSLSYFRSFPFDKVKIDQSFVRDMGTSPQAMAVVRAVIGLGKTLGMRVLAEGVETPSQIRLLEQEGCELAQGYALGRPAAIETFDALLRGKEDALRRAA